METLVHWGKLFDRMGTGHFVRSWVQWLDMGSSGEAAFQEGISLRCRILFSLLLSIYFYVNSHGSFLVRMQSLWGLISIVLGFCLLKCASAAGRKSQLVAP